MKLKLFYILLFISFSFSKTIDQKLLSEKICDAHINKIKRWKDSYAMAGELSPSLYFFLK
jgi:hypothetical protein